MLEKGPVVSHLPRRIVLNEISDVRFRSLSEVGFKLDILPVQIDRPSGMWN